QESQCHYIRPVTGGFVVSAKWPQADPWPNVEHEFRRRGRARVRVQSEVLGAEGKIAVVHDGVFVLTSDA
ncbi:MAG: YiiD C-terminal domain-containing protein, partial [Pseudomonadota bacterium]